MPYLNTRVIAWDITAITANIKVVGSKEYSGDRHEPRTLRWGIRGARSPLWRPPPLATPIATPLQGGRPERPGLLFL